MQYITCFALSYIRYTNMKTGDQDSSDPNTAKVSKARQLMERCVVQSMTTLVTNTFDHIFFTQVDNHFVLRFVFTFLFIGYQISYMRSIGVCRFRLQAGFRTFNVRNSIILVTILH